MEYHSYFRVEWVLGLCKDQDILGYYVTDRHGFTQGNFRIYISAFKHHSLTLDEWKYIVELWINKNRLLNSIFPLLPRLGLTIYW